MLLGQSRTSAGQAWAPTLARLLGVLGFALLLGTLTVSFTVSGLAKVIVPIAFVVVLYIRTDMIIYVLAFLVMQIGSRRPEFLCPGVMSTGIPLIGVIAGVTAIVYMVHRATHSQATAVRHTPLRWALLFLLGYGFLSVFWSPATVGQNLTHLLDLLLDTVFLFMVFRLVDSEKTLRRVLYCLMLSGVILALETVFAPYVYVPRETRMDLFHNLFLNMAGTIDPGTRACGVYQDPLATSIWLACLVPLGMGIILTESSRLRRLLVGGAVCLFLFAIYLTKSKVGSWALIPMIVGVFLVSVRTRSRFFTLSFLSLALVVMVFAASHTWGQRVLFPGSRSGARILTVNVDAKMGTIDSRLFFWKKGFQALDETSLGLLGLGVGGYRSYYPELLLPHNVYFGLYFDYGIAAVVVILAVAVALGGGFLRRIRKMPQDTSLQTMSMSVGMMGIGVALMSVVYLSHAMPFLWFVVGLTSATFSLADQEIREE